MRQVTVGLLASVGFQTVFVFYGAPTTKVSFLFRAVPPWHISGSERRDRPALAAAIRPSHLPQSVSASSQLDSCNNSLSMSSVLFLLRGEELPHWGACASERTCTRRRFVGRGARRRTWLGRRCKTAPRLRVTAVERWNPAEDRV